MALRKVSATLEPITQPVAPSDVAVSGISAVPDAAPERAYDKESYWRNKEERDITRDRRMSRAGLYQAALQSPALLQYAPTLEAYLELVKKTAEAGLKFVNEAA